jgi:hypothetical protein
VQSLYDYANFSAGANPLGFEVDGCPMDKAGTWKVRVQFIEKTTNKILDDVEEAITATSGGGGGGTTTPTLKINNATILAGGTTLYYTYSGFPANANVEGVIYSQGGEVMSYSGTYTNSSGGGSDNWDIDLSAGDYTFEIYVGGKSAIAHFTVTDWNPPW